MPWQDGAGLGVFGELSSGMTDSDYPTPVFKLLTVGDCRGVPQWSDYLALGIGPEHIPHLMCMSQVDVDNLRDWEDVQSRLGLSCVFAVRDREQNEYLSVL